MRLIPKTVDSQFLVRVIKNEVSPEEREFFESWLHESDVNKEEFGNFVLLWDKTGGARIPGAPDAHKQFASIKKKLSEKSEQKNEQVNSNLRIYQDSKSSKELNTAEDTSLLQPTLSEKFFDILAWSGKAAAFIAVVILSYYLIIRSGGQEVTLTMAPDVPAEKTEYVTLKGERVTITLSDGTIVYMNSNSRLVYPKIFKGSTREVELMGEAYFAAAHDKTKPFKVRTGSTTTEVVGTEFNLKFRSNKMDLVVTQGAVKAYRNSSDNFISIKKGEMTTFSIGKGFSKPEKVNTHQYIAWRENKLSFHHAQLYEVMNEIETYYNIQVVYLNKKIKNRTLTGVFDADSIDRVLSMISLTMEMDIHREGKKIIVN